MPFLCPAEPASHFLYLWAEMRSPRGRRKKKTKSGLLAGRVMVIDPPHSIKFMMIGRLPSRPCVTTKSSFGTEKSVAFPNLFHPRNFKSWFSLDIKYLEVGVLWNSVEAEGYAIDWIDRLIRNVNELTRWSARSSPDDVQDQRTHPALVDFFVLLRIEISITHTCRWRSLPTDFNGLPWYFIY